MVKIGAGTHRHESLILPTSSNVDSACQIGQNSADKDQVCLTVPGTLAQQAVTDSPRQSNGFWMPKIGLACSD